MDVRERRNDAKKAAQSLLGHAISRESMIDISLVARFDLDAQRCRGSIGQLRGTPRPRCAGQSRPRRGPGGYPMPPKAEYPATKIGYELEAVIGHGAFASVHIAKARAALLLGEVWRVFSAPNRP